CPIFLSCSPHLPPLHSFPTPRSSDLTEPMQELLGKYRSLLPAPDLVRLLAVLTELEPQLHSSGNVRLAVELLLLRWAMMSRTVELEAVIRALGKEPVRSEERRVGKEGRCRWSA